MAHIDPDGESRRERGCFSPRRWMQGSPGNRTVALESASLSFGCRDQFPSFMSSETEIHPCSLLCSTGTKFLSFFLQNFLASGQRREELPAVVFKTICFLVAGFLRNEQPQRPIGCGCVSHCRTDNTHIHTRTHKQPKLHPGPQETLHQ